MNIFKHEFKMKIRSVLTWSISLVLMIFLFLSLFTSMAADADLLNQAMSQMPKELLMAFNMETMDFSTVLGYFSFIFLFCQICLAIQASNYGFGLVSIEEREMTADFLLAKPIKRSSILTAKLLAALLALTITNAVIWVSSFMAIDMYRGDRPLDQNTLYLLLGSIVLFQMFFFSVGLVLSLFMKRVRAVTPLAMALGFGMFILNAFSGMLGDAKLELITAFKHFDPNYMIANGRFDTPLVLINVGISILAIVASYSLYAKRNIHTAV